MDTFRREIDTSTSAVIQGSHNIPELHPISRDSPARMAGFDGEFNWSTQHFTF
jgi:hypothetical protein